MQIEAFLKFSVLNKKEFIYKLQKSVVYFSFKQQF